MNERVICDDELVEMASAGRASAPTKSEAVVVGDAVDEALMPLSVGAVGVAFLFACGFDWKLDFSCLWALLSMPFALIGADVAGRRVRNNSSIAAASNVKPVCDFV